MNINDRILWTRLKIPGVTVSVGEVSRDLCSVFRVRSLIDLGLGRKTALLDPVSFPELEGKDALHRNFPKNKLAIPKKMSNLNLVCTSKGFMALPSLYTAIRHMQAKTKLGVIDPEVLAPGDYVMFEHSCKSFKPKFSKALRALKTTRKNPGQNHDAV